MRRLLVTGGSGFIGTNLVRHAVEAGCPVVNVDHRAPRDPGQREHWLAGDVLEAAELRRIVADFRPDHVVHLAAETSQQGRSMTDYSVNIDGVRAMLEALAAVGGVARSVFASTRLVCDLGITPICEFDYAPPNFYARSKVIAEQLVRASAGAGEWLLVRPTSIWGPWGREPYRDFFIALARGRYVHPAGVTALKHYGFVGNVVAQIDRLLTGPSARIHGRTFYLADPEPVEVGEFARLIRDRMGLAPPRVVPLALLRVAATVGDLAQATGRIRAPLTSDRLGNLRTPMLFDLGELASLTGPPAYGLIEGIDATIAHLRSTGDLPAVTA